MIRQATIEDLPRLEPLAREFYAASAHLKGFEAERFIKLWTSLMESGTGVIFLLQDGEEIHGTISGVCYPEQYSSRLIAQEFFWFVAADKRGGAGRALFDAFEEWARFMECSEIRMGHLVDVMPEKVAKFYEREGFHKVEVAYAKELTCAV